MRPRCNRSSMPDYTLVNLADVDDAAVAGGFSEVQEAHFATRDLGLADQGRLEA